MSDPSSHRQRRRRLVACCASTARDPGDDYLIALAERARAMLVSGDEHLLELADAIPVLTPAAFLSRFVPEPPSG